MTEPEPNDSINSLVEMLSRLVGISSGGLSGVQIDMVDEDEDPPPHDWDSVFDPLVAIPQEVTDDEARARDLMAQRNTLWQLGYHQAVYQTRHMVAHLRNADVDEEVISGLVTILRQQGTVAAMLGRAHLETTISLAKYFSTSDISYLPKHQPLDPYPPGAPDNSFQVLYKTLQDSWYGDQFPGYDQDFVEHRLTHDDFSDLPCKDNPEK